MAGIDITFQPTVTAQQRQWVESAMKYTRFPVDRGNLTVIVRTLDEPPCAGHSDYMCTQTVGASTVTIRAGADDPSADFNSGVRDNLQAFFMESFIHEVIGHAFAFTHMATDDAKKTQIAGWFRSSKIGGGAGVLADWNPLDKDWADRIQEGLAEFLKDLYMPAEYRYYQNRTNWDMQKDKFGELIAMIELTICPVIGGGDS